VTGQESSGQQVRHAAGAGGVRRELDAVFQCHEVGPRLLARRSFLAVRAGRGDQARYEVAVDCAPAGRHVEAFGRCEALHDGLAVHEDGVVAMDDIGDARRRTAGAEAPLPSSGTLCYKGKPSGYLQ
jgi:hypothetical protein